MKRFVRGLSASALVLLAAAVAAPVGRAAGTVRQVTDVKTTVAGPGVMNDAGTLVFAGSSADLTGANPAHTFQILRFDPVTGTPTAETSAPEGVSVLFSVSDDGRYLAFPSPADLTGNNHDKSIELFVLDRNSGQITQLTNDPAPNAGSVSSVVMAGSGNRVVFTANTNPLGTNPENLDQMFVVDLGGTNLRQITSFGPGISVGGITVSDDGTRIAFSSSADLTGGNPDLGGEIFTINFDGTGLRQLTSTAATFDSGSPSLSGNGAKIAFESNGDLVVGNNLVHQTEIFVIDWAGTGLRQLTKTGRVLGLLGDPASNMPSITDDGLTVFYSSNDSRLFPPLNLDGNYEIFKIKSDGTGKTALTNSILDIGSLFPTAAGNGGRVTYYGLGTNVTLEVMDGAGASQRTLLAFDLIFQSEPDIAPAGDRLVFTKSVGLFASGQIFKVESDGSGLAQVTSLTSGNPSGPSLAGDGETIVFSADSDPLGTNADTSGEIFTIRADGTGLRQLTSGASGTTSSRAVISRDGRVVVFDSDADLSGANADASTEIFKINFDGTGLVQITNGIAGTVSRVPRVDATGTWVVFESNADLDGGNPDGTYEVWRARVDGTALERLTGDPLLDSGGADISGDGTTIVYSSEANPLGTNPEGNSEIFLWNAATSGLAQLTSFTKGSSGSATISGNGTWVYFASNAPVFETDPDSPGDTYRIAATGGSIQRVGGLRAGAIGSLGAFGAIGGGGSALAVGDSGDIAAFSGFGDFTGGNKDLLSEMWILDRNAVPEFSISKASPTVLSWTVESGPVRYDAIRGNLANVRFQAGSVDLGPVQCLEKNSPDADTKGFGDGADPSPGQVFFYLYRGSQGLSDTGSYGQSSDGRERTAGAGGC
jgi:Tol biopolymer transport system component